MIRINDMKKIMLVLITGISCVLHAQKEANPGMNELKEKVLGWEPMMAPNGNAPGKSLTVQGRTYSSYQIGLIDLFTDWIKKSYIPIGGLAQPERIALPDSRENKVYLPRGTGVGMALWVPCYDASGKKITRAQPASRSYIAIFTNHLKGLEEANFYSTPSQHIFTMYYDKNGKLVNSEEEPKYRPFVKEVQSKIGNYFCYFTGGLVNILLSPTNDLPVVQLTIGEVLDEGIKAGDRVYPNQGDPSNIKIKTGVKRLREKYKNRLNDPAFINHVQLSPYNFDNDWSDLFERRINDQYMYPVYRIKPEVYELSKQDKPQWIHISFPYADAKSNTRDWEIYKAMTTNFNYEYVYNYFFAPEKVKRQAYQPRVPISKTDALNTINARENNAGKTKIFPAGIHFMEDFADAQSGTMPAGWTSTQNNRSFTIETPAGQSGKWVYMDSGSDLVPSSIKKPLPANFTLEYDLVCTDYKNRNGRMVTLQLSNNQTQFSLGIQPGNADNITIYPSEANLRVNYKENSGYHYMAFSSYSNKTTKARVKIVKSGTSIKAFINGVQVKADSKYKQDYDKETKLPDNTLFTNISWRSDTIVATEDKGKVYISNIKISNN
jgi:hypothetical protein